jgi:hypothetical protein
LLFSKQRKLENNIQDGGAISEATYPIREHWTQCFYRTTALQSGFFEAAYSTRKVLNLPLDAAAGEKLSAFSASTPRGPLSQGGS